MQYREGNIVYIILNIEDIIIILSMKALFYNFSKKKFILRETAIPKIKSDEVLVKVKVSALCGTDLHIMGGPLIHKVYNKKEIILGHSFSRIVSKIGRRVKNFKVGDRVFASDFVWCGKCKQCRGGKENLCDNRYIFGMEVPGSHAEYLNVPQRALYKLPRNISFEEGSLICDLLALGVHAVKKASLSSKDKIIIFGVGPVGLTLGILLKLYGVKPIFIVEPVKYRQNLAKKLFGAKIIDEKNFTKFQREIDIVFETSGENKALEGGYKLLKRGGKMVMIGVQNKNFNLRPLKWISRELSLFGIFDFTSRDIKESLKLIQDKKIDLRKIITHRFSLGEGKKAYQLLKICRSGKIILIA